MRLMHWITLVNASSIRCYTKDIQYETNEIINVSKDRLHK